MRPALALALLALSLACGSAPSFRRGVYRDEELTFRVGSLPPPWRRVQVAGSDLAFHNDEVSGVVAVNAECNREKDPPLRQLLMQLVIGFTAREHVVEELIPLDGREALHGIVRARIDGVPMMLDLYVLKKDECLYDFSYAAPPSTFERGRAEYEAFVQGFHVAPRRDR